MTDIAKPEGVDSARSNDDISVDTAQAAANELGEFRSLRTDVWRQFRRHKGALVGVVILFLKHEMFSGLIRKVINDYGNFAQIAGGITVVAGLAVLYAVF